MDDHSINKELKQKLNFSCCEEESENEGQKEVQESGEAQSQTPEKSEGQDPEAQLTPPRTPVTNTRELFTSQEKDKVSPDPVLRTLVSESPKGPATPDPPDDRSKLLRCESPFTPKVSELWGRGTQISSVQLIEKEDSVICVYMIDLPPRLHYLQLIG